MIKKIIFSILALGCLWGCKTAEKLYPSPLEVTWRMDGNRMDADSTHYKTVWCFKNVSDAPLDNNWILYYNQFSRVPKYEDNTPVKLEQVVADFYRIYPTENYKTLEPGDSMVVTIYLRGSALKKTEGPMGMYFVPCDEFGKELSPVKMKPVELSFVNTPKSLLRSKKDQYPFPTGQYLYSMDKDLVLTDSVAHTDIIPSVKEVLLKGKNITIPSSLQISAPAVLDNEKEILSSLLKEENNANVASNGAYTIKLALNQELTNQEAYTVTLDSSSAIISGATPAGVFYGIQTLRSMLNGVSLPFTTQSVTINDAPDMEYRGFMLDVARNFQTKEAIMRILDVMAHYKLNKFHFHFNDDEAWRLEIPGLPELTEYGARRGHTLDEKNMLHPAFGSGPDAFDVNSNGYGYFTRKEFIEILRYAKKLHIDVVPEIETPGHARAAVFSMKNRYEKYKNTDIQKAEQYLMSDPDDTSKYSSAQAFHDNVMCVAREGVYNFLDKVVTEIQAMYTEADAFLPAIQTGGDEVPRGAWLGSPLCQKLVTDGKIAEIGDLRDYFTTRFKNILNEKGLKYWGWMEIASKKGKPNPKFLGQGFMAFCWDTVGEWGGEQIPYILANAGYDIILCNAPNVYFDFAYGKSADEPGLYWGGWGGERLSFDLLPYDVYRSVRLGLQGAVMNWDTAPFKADGSAKEVLTANGKKHIRGIQGELWSETVKGEQMMQYYIFPKMFGLSERSWNASPAWADVKDASARSAAYNAAIGHYLSVIDAKGMSFLEKKGMDFRIAPPGIEIIDSTLYISNSVPSGDVYYTTDGTAPSSSSKRWTSPVCVSGTDIQAITIAHGKKSSISKYYAE